MKNTHILSLQEEVPIEIRKQVYQEAVEYYSRPKDMILYDKNKYFKKLKLWQ